MPDAPKSFHLSPEIHDYLVRHGTPPDDIQRGLIEETRRLGGVAMMQIAPEQGAFMTLLTRAHRRAPGHRGRHLHRLLGALPGARPARGRPSALLRRQRGVDRRREAVLGEGRRRRPYRAADRAGGRDAARAAGRPGRRHRLHRRRQGRLPDLLRGDPEAAATGRADPRRQRALHGHGRRSRGAQRQRGRDPALQRPGGAGRAGRPRHAGRGRRPHPGPEAVERRRRRPGSADARPAFLGPLAWNPPIGAGLHRIRAPGVHRSVASPSRRSNGVGLPREPVSN